jgi:hypothetical protein
MEAGQSICAVRVMGSPTQTGAALPIQVEVAGFMMMTGNFYTKVAKERKGWLAL